MTKKDLIVIAEIVRSIRNVEDRVRAHAVAADRLSAVNPRFDRGLFRLACNVGDDAPPPVTAYPLS